MSEVPKKGPGVPGRAFKVQKRSLYEDPSERFKWAGEGTQGYWRGLDSGGPVEGYIAPLARKGVCFAREGVWTTRLRDWRARCNCRRSKREKKSL